ncbi:MAG: dienelactone hydrolase family protein [Actinomycetota bacterium]
MALSDYEKTAFSHDGKTRDVFRRGSGPAVIVIAEMPGITPNVLTFADRIVDLGCTAVLPRLFGEPGRALSLGYGVSSMIPACISRDFTAFATRRTSPVIDWLRALARHEHEVCGGPGVGAVGMCFTGGFALAMAVDDTVIAPVLSQPSLPFPLSKKHKRDVGLSDSDLDKVKHRCAAEDFCVLGLRFTGDKIVPAERFARLRSELGDAFVGVEIDSSPGNQWGHPKAAHSVLTEHLKDEPGQPTRDALDRVLDLFRRKLLAGAQT